MPALPVLGAALLLVATPLAQRLPFRTFGTGAGLPHENVAVLREDSRGFLWVGTWEGLACFDGSEFTRPGAEAFGGRIVFALGEDARGDVWAGAHGAGLVRLVFGRALAPGERAAELFEVGPEPADNRLEAVVFLGATGWVASERALFALTLDPSGRPSFARRWDAPEDWTVQGVARVGQRAWIVSPERCVELSPTDATPRAGPGTGTGYDTRAEADGAGRMLLWTSAGLVEFTPPGEFRALDFEPPPGARVKATALGPDGRRWIGTTHGLLRSSDAGYERLGRAAGLPSESIACLTFDRDGHLWVGTHDGGVAVLAAESPLAFSRDGERVSIARVVRTGDGRMLAVGRGLHEVTAGGLVALPGSERPPLERTEGFVTCDRAGALWVGTGAGLLRGRWSASGIALESEPLVPGKCTGRPREAPDGTLRISVEPGTLYRSTPDGRFVAELDWPEREDPVREAEVGKDGELWLLGWRSLWRRDEHGVAPVRIDGDAPEPRAFVQDGRGRVWIGRRHGGLAWTDEPTAATPRFTRLTSADGLPSDTVWDLELGREGELWIATGRGLARRDPASGALRAWSDQEGIVGAVFDVLCAPDGAVWTATSSSVARLDPRAEPARQAPRVLVQGFEAGGESVVLPAGGVAGLAGVELASRRDSVVVRFGAVDLVQGDALQFQTRLGDGAWSAPSRARSLHLARLEPGDYHIGVRALAPDGRTSAPAEVAFTLRAPLWRQPWFLALALAAAGALAYALHRARLGRLLALERVRTQIAGDLHDEVGAGLAQIAIVAEVARREAGPAAGAHLGELAELARTTRTAMSDLVWAIDPRRDRLIDLVARMQAATAQMLEPGGVEFDFKAPAEAELARVELGPEARRQLLFFFKEALTNAARHARARRVEVELALGGGELSLGVADDGRGFEPEATQAGHGLANLRRRARELGARLELESRPGQGTRVALSLPLA
jgi:signal transduction histidine kinase